MKTNILIVGAGKGGKALINLFYKRETINILGVIDIKDDAPGIKLAKKLGIPTAADYKEFLDKKGLDEIINVTGSQVVQEELLKRRPANVEIIAGHSAKLMWSLIEKSEKAEKALRESEGRLKTVLDSIQAGVVVIEEETHTILDVNSVAAKMVGVPKEKIVGQVCHKFICPAEEGACPITDLGQDVDKSERGLINVKGENIPILKSVARIMLGGHRCLIESFLDITKRKEAEEALKNYAKQVERANKELDDFTYIVSHDLKEPLRSIDAFSKFIEDDYKDRLEEEGKNYFRRIRANASKMQALIDDLLEISRIERKKNIFEQVESEELVKEARLRLEYAIKQKNVGIAVRDKLPKVFCDRVRLLEVFVNLISNAVKFNDKPNPRVEIGCSKKGAFYEFYIKDNGPGIEEQYFDKIFEIFQRCDKGEGYEGTGAGLTIVKKIVQMHRGRIRVESKVGEGATFYFTIPVYPQRV